MAEIGVWEGAFSAEILEVVRPVRLHLIDPWEYQPDFPNTAFGKKRNADRLDRMHDAVRARFAQDTRVVIHRARSEVALAAIPDQTLDCIYIDGNHNEPAISTDLALALRKVRPGGVISGGDYYWNKAEGAPVRTAVDRMVAELGAGCDFARMGQQYVIRLKGLAVQTTGGSPFLSAKKKSGG